MKSFKFIHGTCVATVYAAVEQDDGYTNVTWTHPYEGSMQYSTASVEQNIKSGVWTVLDEPKPSPTLTDRIREFTKGTDFAVLFARDRYEVIAFSKVFIAENDDELLELFGKIEDLATWSKA